jgi:hypothetical protein
MERNTLEKNTNEARSLKGASYHRQAPAFHVCLDGRAPPLKASVTLLCWDRLLILSPPNEQALISPRDMIHLFKQLSCSQLILSQSKPVKKNH